MSNLYEQIPKRKSVRKYTNQVLTSDVKESINQAIDELTLYTGEPSTLRFEITSYDEFVRDKKLNFITKKMIIKSPYYLSIYRNNTKDAYINAGYCGEELVLRLKELGLDTCWVGAANVFDRGQDFIIGIAFGYSDVDATVKRKRDNIEDYYTGEPCNMKVVEAVRHAPSAKNSQPARIKFYDDKIEMVNKNRGDRILKDLNIIDMGIALRHLTLALDEYRVTYADNKFIIK